MSSLDVWMNGRHVGVWRQIRGGRDQFVYDAAWLADPQFRALSLSLPVTVSRDITSPLVRNYSGCVLRCSTPCSYGSRPHYKWDEIQPRHFKALAQSLPDPDLWPAMLDMARSAPDAIASVKKRLPADFKEAVWTSITKGFAKKAEEFLGVAEKLHD